MGSHFVWAPYFLVIILLGHNQTALTAGSMADRWELFKDLIASSGEGGRVGKAVPWLLLRLKRRR